MPRSSYPVTSNGNREVKRGAAPGLRFHPDATPTALHDLLADGQPDARAGVLFVGVQPLEDREDTLGILGLDSDAVIADGKNPFISLLLGRNVNPGRLDVELDGVPDQVLKQLHQQQFVMHYPR